LYRTLKFVKKEWTNDMIIVPYYDGVLSGLIFLIASI